MMATRWFTNTYVTIIVTLLNLNQSLVVYRISTRACHFKGRARAGFDSPPGSFFLFLFFPLSRRDVMLVYKLQQ